MRAACPCSARSDPRPSRRAGNRTPRSLGERGRTAAPGPCVAAPGVKQAASHGDFAQVQVYILLLIKK
uniref:Uncharacterized protein n=1 Tax=Arundo donax TaxID=35708 RepID=A0A0A8YDS8_ARUDO